MEIIYTSERKISCSGDKIDDHPLIYLSLEQKDKVICPYCSRAFALKKEDENAEKT